MYITSQYSDLFPFPWVVDHHLCADDTELFSFHPLNFDSSISYLQNAVQQISFYITVNLLTLNSYETEFLLIWLKNNYFDTQPFTWYLSLYSKFWHYLWRTSYLLWPNCISLVSSRGLSTTAMPITCVSENAVFSSRSKRWWIKAMVSD